MWVLFMLAVDLLIAFVAWRAGNQAWASWRGRHPLPADVPPDEQNRHQLRQMFAAVLDGCAGRHGRSRQLGLIALLLVVFALMSFRGVWLGVVALALAGLYLYFQPMPIQRMPPSTSPSIPPQPLSPSVPIRGGSGSRGPVSWGIGFTLAVGVLLYFSLGVGEVPERVRHHVPQAAAWMHNVDSEGPAGSREKVRSSRDGVLLTSDRRNLSAEPTYPAERGETPGKESTHQEKGGILASPTGAASIPAAETPASASPHESVPSGAGEDRPNGPTRFSALGPTESEARRSLLTKVGEHLTQAALRAGRPIEMADWVPGELWTQKNFARSIVYRQIPSKTPGVNLSTAEVTVDPLDERKIEQVFAEFVNDRVAGRSLSLLKGFAGTVLVLGGASVFLRLGTGRTLTSPAGSSKQKSWLQRLRRNTK